MYGKKTLHPGILNKRRNFYLRLEVFKRATKILNFPMLHRVLFHLFIKDFNSIEILNYCMVLLDKKKNLVIFNKTPFQLSKNEVLLIEYLYKNKGSIISHDELVCHCWPGRMVSASSLPVAIKHIRDMFKKLSSKEVIKTYKGEGYAFLLDIEITITESLDELPAPVDKQTGAPHANNIKIPAYRYFLCGIYILIIAFSVFLFLYNASDIRTRKINETDIFSNFDFDTPLPEKGMTSIFLEQGGKGIFCDKYSCEYQ